MNPWPASTKRTRTPTRTKRRDRRPAPGPERGFELTYYFDTIGEPNSSTGSGAKPIDARLKLLFDAPLATLPLLREWGDMPRSVTITPRNGSEWAEMPGSATTVARKDDSAASQSLRYVMQHRRGVYMPHEWWLEHHGRPCFSVKRQGVNLLRVYTFNDLRDAVEATKGGTIFGQAGVARHTSRAVALAPTGRGPG